MASEKRLIDANELTDRLNHTTMVAYPNLFPGLLAAVEVVDDSPTVDAVEVVHGRWECTYDAERGETDVLCSNCKSTRTINGCYVTSTGESCYFDDNYCPNCGAKMDGDGNV